MGEDQVIEKVNQVLSQLLDELTEKAPPVWGELIDYLVNSQCNRHWSVLFESQLIRFDWRNHYSDPDLPRGVFECLGRKRNKTYHVTVVLSVQNHRRGVQIVCTDADRGMLSWHKVTHRWWQLGYWKSVRLITSLLDNVGEFAWDFSYCGKVFPQHPKSSNRFWWFPPC